MLRSSRHGMVAAVFMSALGLLPAKADSGVSSPEARAYLQDRARVPVVFAGTCGVVSEDGKTSLLARFRTTRRSLLDMALVLPNGRVVMMPAIVTGQRVDHNSQLVIEDIADPTTNAKVARSMAEDAEVRSSGYLLPSPLAAQKALALMKQGMATLGRCEPPFEVPSPSKLFEDGVEHGAPSFRPRSLRL